MKVANQEQDEPLPQERPFSSSRGGGETVGAAVRLRHQRGYL